MGDNGVMLSRPRAWITRVAQGAVGIGLLALVWQLADGGQAIEILVRANIFWILAAIAVLSLQIALSSWRWRITAWQLGISLTPGIALREYYLSQIINQSLPGGVVGDASRAVRAKNHTGMLASVQAVLLERVMGQIGLLLVFTAAFLVTLVMSGGLDWPGWLASTIGVAIVAVIAVPIVFGGIVRVLPPRPREFLINLERSAVRAVFHPSVLWSHLGLSLTTAMTNISGFVFCAWALDVPLGFGVALAVVPLALFTMLIPVTVSGWGLREGAAVALFPLAGLGAAEGLATSVAFGLVLIVIALPGLWFLRTARARAIR